MLIDILLIPLRVLLALADALAILVRYRRVRDGTVIRAVANGEVRKRRGRLVLSLIDGGVVTHRLALTRRQLAEIAALGDPALPAYIAGIRERIVSHRSRLVA